MNELGMQGGELSKDELLKLLERGKYLWESTFDAIAEPVLVIDEDFKIDRANLSAARDASMPVQKMIGEYCYQAFAGRDTKCPECPVALAQEKSSLPPFKNKEEYLASQFSLSGKNEDLNFHVLHYQNMTKLRELEERLIQSEKLAAIGLLANGVAHEINNPLGGILAFSQLAKKDLDPESQTFQDLSEIENSALTCKKIIEDLLTFARPASKLEKLDFELAPVIQKASKLVAAQWKKKNVDLKINVEGVYTWVYGNPNRLEQVFVNLIANAFHAVEDQGGKIQLSAFEHEGEVEIAIADNGCGISEENVPKVFDPYFSTKERGEGSGLGLSISYQIIQAHGGILEVKSDEQGTRFSVFLKKSREGEKS